MTQLINSNESVFLDYEMFIRIQNIYYNLLIQALQKHCKRNFLNKLDLGANLSYMRVHNTGVDANSTWGSPLGSALYLAPTLPVTLRGQLAQDMIDRYSAYDLYTDAAGNPYTIQMPGIYKRGSRPAFYHG